MISMRFLMQLNPFLDRNTHTHTHTRPQIEMKSSAELSTPAQNLFIYAVVCN